VRDPLADYRDKRDFRRTPEPTGDGSIDRPGNGFVVHRHEARQLHYDLRLEHGGVLKSWAVPRGFSYDPAQKRLAVRTEDHPLAYEHFHGRIPAGQYGAGTMTIWDRGHFALTKITEWDAAMAAGELKILLFGRRLRGEWHLVRTQQGPGTWLLFKSRDRYAGPSRDSALGIDLAAAPAAPAAIAGPPMHWQGERPARHDPDWLFELAFRGQRTFAHHGPEGTSLADFTGPAAAPLLAGLRALRCERAVLDGIVVANAADGRPDGDALRQARAAGDGSRLAYYAFDLLQWEEFDLRPLPLCERKAALRTLIPEQGPIQFVDHVAGDAAALLHAVRAAGLPAAIGKRAQSPYVHGPSPDWQRLVAMSGDTPANPSANASDAAGAATATAPTASATRWQPSNLGKVYWPAEGYTKGDLLAYYAAVAEALLPHLQGRPLHLNRFPDGIDGKSFYQREVKEGSPAWVRTVPIPHDGTMVLHHVVEDLDTLLHVVNLGSIDLHPWLSRTGSLDEPDFAVLDLDPKQAPFTDVVRIARAAGKLLRGIGLRPLLKTSGKTGMHIYVPLLRGYTYEHGRAFLEGVARTLVRQLPDIATIERSPDRRDGRVYLDFLQNRRSQTIVPPYSVRPVRHASVSAPLAWDELEDDGLSPQRFTILSMPARLRERGDLFAAALHDRQDLLPAIEALAVLLRER
jgi:bifunctional non-homologous end joining protein LigD